MKDSTCEEQDRCASDELHPEGETSGNIDKQAVELVIAGISTNHTALLEPLVTNHRETSEDEEGNEESKVSRLTMLQNEFKKLTIEGITHPRNRAVVAFMIFKKPGMPVYRRDFLEEAGLKEQYFDADHFEANVERLRKSFRSIAKHPVIGRFYETPGTKSGTTHMIRIPNDERELERLIPQLQEIKDKAVTYEQKQSDQQSRDRVVSTIRSYVLTGRGEIPSTVELRRFDLDVFDVLKSLTQVPLIHAAQERLVEVSLQYQVCLIATEEQTTLQITEVGLEKQEETENAATKESLTERLKDLLAARFASSRTRAILLFMVNQGDWVSRSDFFNDPYLSEQFFAAEKASTANMRYWNSLDQIRSDAIGRELYEHSGTTDDSKHRIVLPTEQADLMDLIQRIISRGEEEALEAQLALRYDVDKAILAVLIRAGGRPMDRRAILSYESVRTYFVGNEGAVKERFKRSIKRLSGHIRFSASPGRRKYWFDPNVPIEDRPDVAINTAGDQLQRRQFLREVHLERATGTKVTKARTSAIQTRDKTVIQSRYKAERESRVILDGDRKAKIVKTRIFALAPKAKYSLAKEWDRENEAAKTHFESYDRYYATRYKLRKESTARRAPERPESSLIVEGTLREKIDLTPISSGIPILAKEFLARRSEKVGNLKLRNEDKVTVSIYDDWTLKVGDKNVKFDSSDFIDRTARNLFSIIVLASLVHEKKVSLLHIITKQKEMSYGNQILEQAWERLKLKVGTAIGQTSPINQNAWFVADHVVLEDKRAA